MKQLDLSGTAYLGLQIHPAYLRVLSQNLAKYGANNPISRNNAGRFEVLETVEASLAEDWQAEDACLLSNGYMAGLAVTLLASKTGRRVCVETNGHPCYQPHNDSSKESRSENPEMIIIDAVDPFTGQSSAASFIEKRGVALKTVAIDVSHTASIWGPTWQGSLEISEGIERIFFGSLGKASAFPAGFVAGPCTWISEIRKLPIYTASAAPAQAYAATYFETTTLREERRRCLMEIIQTVKRDLGCNLSDFDFPVTPLQSESASHLQRFQAQGIHLSSLPYPNADSPPRVRCVLNASLTAADCSRIIEAIAPWLA